MDIDRHGPRLMPNNWKNLDPPYFSLPTTFKNSDNLFLSKIRKNFRSFREISHKCSSSNVIRPFINPRAFLRQKVKSKC
jgi:hypothetical protein